MAMRRTSRGRQKIEMMKIENENHLQVTFSKRRAGLFKKASELSTLCGAEVGLVVFSPANRVYSFGHPDVESIIDRYYYRNPPVLQDQTKQLIKAHRDASARGLNLQLACLQSQMEIERKRGKELDQVVQALQARFWWNAPKSELDLEELQKLKATMEELKANVQAHLLHTKPQFINVADNSLHYQPAEAAASPVPFQLVGPNPSEAVIQYDPNVFAFGNSLIAPGYNSGNDCGPL